MRLGLGLEGLWLRAMPQSFELRFVSIQVAKL